MKVILAGYNVDTNVLDKMRKECAHREDVTPETISAAYARISRDPRPIDQIRKDACEEVERTRKSNETIIFKMGHHSVAEHAVFNFDILGVSRYAMESLERFRLCSYTEKSQRYITLEDDFVIPPEIKNSSFEPSFVGIIREQNAFYHVLFKMLKDYVFAKNSDLAINSKNHTLLEGWAKEDARYITSFATEAQVGLTVNARNLELILRRFASHPLEEIRMLGTHIYDCVKKIAPSIIIFHKANEFDEKTYSDLRTFSQELSWEMTAHRAGIDGGDVHLVHYDENGDSLIAASLLHTVGTHSFEECLKKIKAMNDEDKMRLFKTACSRLQLFDSLPREFEYASLTYDMIISAACFGQLKRHRMTTISTQEYDPGLGITIPLSVKETGMEKEFKEIIEKTNDVYDTLYQKVPYAAPYVLTNAHQRRVLMRTNMRELYHMSRLREDTHAQWDIHEKTAGMTQEARKVMPFSCMLIGGKDTFPNVYENVYGVLPQIREAALPGTRNIE
ncbi:MAG: FAD-dependent thymidylate synthase [Candidatus Omnitrophica bacterium]|nr:FAD-dependent thymidylate synthase [Candidatus Omnitrophota bacterium]